MAEHSLPDFIFDKQNLESESARLLTIIKPTWDVKNLSIHRITKGGNSSIIFRCFVKNKEDDTIIIRIQDIDKELCQWLSETGLKVMQEMSKHGHFPKIHAIFSNGSCYQYAVGKQVFNPSTRIGSITDEVLKAIAEEMAFLHSIQVPGEEFKGSKKFENIRITIEKSEQLHVEHESIPKKEVLLEELRMVENYLKDIESPVGICHNDIHPGNMVWNEDDKKLTIMDWDGASMGHQLGDVAFFLNFIEIFNPLVAPDMKLTVTDNAEDKFLEWYFKASGNTSISFEEFVQNAQSYKLTPLLSCVTMYMLFPDKYFFLGEGHRYLEHTTAEYLKLKEKFLGSGQFETC